MSELSLELQGAVGAVLAKGGAVLISPNAQCFISDWSEGNQLDTFALLQNCLRASNKAQVVSQNPGFTNCYRDNGTVEWLAEAKNLLTKLLNDFAWSGETFEITVTAINTRLYRFDVTRTLTNRPVQTVSGVARPLPPGVTLSEERLVALTQIWRQKLHTLRGQSRTIKSLKAAVRYYRYIYIWELAEADPKELDKAPGAGNAGIGLGRRLLQECGLEYNTVFAPADRAELVLRSPERRRP